MTKFILAGGCDRLYPEYLTQLARVIETAVQQPKILSCWFSNSDEESEAKFPEYQAHFLKFFSEGSSFIKADRVTFIDQIRSADVIYFHGGHTELLFTALEPYGDLRASFEGKIVVGSSAGTNYLSSFGFSPRKASAQKGSGILDIATVVHYGSAGFGDMKFEPSFWDDAVKQVREKSGKQEVLLLHEGTFSVIDT